jgi:hypothetical protein
MEKNIVTLEIDSLGKIFAFIKENHGENGQEKRTVITNMDQYEVIPVIINDGIRACACVFGFREKSNNDGQVLVGWAQMPIGTGSCNEINVLDPKPFVKVETFKNPAKGPQLKVEYSAGTLTTGTLLTFTKIMQALQSAIAFVLLPAHAS